MKLEHLTPAQAAIFRVIRQHGETSRGRIIETLCRKGPHKMPEGTISSCLSRLEGFGFIARPDEAVAGWRLTPEGVALFADAEVEVVDPTLPGTELPEPAPAPFIVSGLDTLRALIDPLLTETVSGCSRVPEPEAEPTIPAFEGAVKSFADGPAQYVAGRALDGSLVDQHLAFVRQQLGGRRAIPAESARVYRELITCLPLSIVEALLPITRLVESRP